MIDTSFCWLCPSCADEVRIHVRALVELFKNEDVFWNGLRYMLKRDGAGKGDVGGRG